MGLKHLNHSSNQALERENDSLRREAPVGALGALVLAVSIYLCFSLPATAQSEAAQDGSVAPSPVSSPVERVVDIPPTHTPERAAQSALIAREAERHGLASALVEAVVLVESGFRPGAIGPAGEVGLMQVRRERAALLGYTGGVTGLFDAETNLRYGVLYLAQAWRLTHGDLCRTLMKYRSGHHEERMTPLLVEYCRRTRDHLAILGSPLAQHPLPPVPHTAVVSSDAPSVVAPPMLLPKSTSARPMRTPKPRSSVHATARMNQLRTQPDTSRNDTASQRFWDAHEARIRNLTRQFRSAQIHRASRNRARME